MSGFNSFTVTSCSPVTEGVLLLELVFNELTIVTRRKSRRGREAGQEAGEGEGGRGVGSKEAEYGAGEREGGNETEEEAEDWAASSREKRHGSDSRDRR